MTSGRTDTPRRGRYGIDAPYLIVLPVAFIVFNLVQGFLSGRPWPFIGAALIGVFCGFGLHASLRGKFVAWARLLDGLGLRGDERVLDVGCGRGAVLLMTAARLTTGRAVGLDLWRRRDQLGNAAGVTAGNAVAEGVADRVALVTADMTRMPIASATFDLVVSSIAIHNVPGADARDRAIEEIVRVVKPGGRIVIADMQRVGRYRERLVALGMADVTVTDLGWGMWWSGPWAATRVVTARRP